MLASIVLLTATRAPFARQADAPLAFVPLPAKVERGRGVFTLTATTVIVADAPGQGAGPSWNCVVSRGYTWRPDESREVTFVLGEADFRMLDRDGRWSSNPGPSA